MKFLHMSDLITSYAAVMKEPEPTPARQRIALRHCHKDVKGVKIVYSFFIVMYLQLFNLYF